MWGATAGRGGGDIYEVRCDTRDLLFSPVPRLVLKVESSGPRAQATDPFYPDWLPWHISATHCGLHSCAARVGDATTFRCLSEIYPITEP